MPLGYRVVRVSLSLGLIAAVTFVYFRLVQVNSTTVALTLLMAVLAIATRWGLLESLAASLAGVLCFNFFFLPPVGTWSIHDPQNWVALFAFVITAAVASQLSSSARRRAAEADSRRHEMERLYTLSRSLMWMDAQSPPAAQIARHVAEVFDFDAVEFYDSAADEIHRAGRGDTPVPAERLRNAAGNGATAADPRERTSVLPVAVGGKVIGSLAVPASSTSRTALSAVAHLAAVALDRARGQEAASRAEAVRQSEELKSTMLDALAHEFKTPLTSIKAAVSAMLSGSPAAAFDPELLQIVDEETDRLTLLVSEAIQMARIEAGRIELRKEPQSVAGLVRDSLSMLGARLEPARIRLQVNDELPLVAADPELIRIVIRQLVDNAVKYSPPDSPIVVRALREGDQVLLAVADRGSGMAEGDRKRIFEKFYRARESRERIPGTGMGLAIAREIVQAHGGEIRVNSRLGEGSEFLFSLPVARET